MLEMKRNKHRKQLYRDISFHSRESNRWRDRFNHAHDLEELERCLREIDAHDRKAANAQAALRNI